jgi:hypothetical protein
MIKKSAEIEIKSNASATKADIDNLSNSTEAAHENAQRHRQLSCQW